MADGELTVGRNCGPGEEVWFSRNPAAADELVAPEYVVHDIGDRKAAREPASGQKQRPRACLRSAAKAAETFRTDGRVVPGTLSSGVTLVAKWISSHVLETKASKDGKEIGVVTYEVSSDGNILTSRSSGAVMPDQLIVFERDK